MHTHLKSHFHGSTALQTSQGAAGMLIIEEPDDYKLPEIIKKMPQVEMLFQHIDLPRLNIAARNSGSKLTTWVEGDNFHITNTTTDRTDLLLVNCNTSQLSLWRLVYGIVGGW